MKALIRNCITLTILLLGMNNMTSMAAGKTIVVLGDSLSAAYEMAAEDGWVDLLQGKITSKGLAYKVQNESISGDTSGNGLYRMREIVRRGKFSHLVLALGANDGLRGLPFQQMQDNLGGIIKMAQEQGAKVFLIGIDLPGNYGNFYKNGFDAVYVALSKEYDVPLLQADLLVAVPKVPEYFNDDGLHPNPKAQPLIMESVWDKLNKYL